MPTDFAPLRHSVARIDAERWRAALAAPLPEPHVRQIDAWFARGYPAVVRRRVDETCEPVAVPTVALGIPLPPASGKLRIPLLLAADAVLAIEPPPDLETTIPCAPTAWRTALRALANAGGNAGIAFRVFGSLAWQHLTGERYLTEGSDIDLLWQPQSRNQAERGLLLLSCWERSCGLRVDGELRLPDGGGVGWRELLTARRSVLIKHEHAVVLRPRDAVLASWSQAHVA